MKNKTLSLIALTAAALLPCVNATAEAITVYDENDTVVAEGSTLSSITSAVDGTSGLTVELSADVSFDRDSYLDTSLLLTKDTSLNLVSNSEVSRFLKRLKKDYIYITPAIKTTALRLDLLIDNIIFSGENIVSLGVLAESASVSVGGNASFQNFKTGDANRGAAINAKEVVFEQNAVITFSGNRARERQGGAIYTTDGITVKKGAKISFVENFARDGSTAITNSSYSYGGAVYGSVNVEEGGEVVFRGNDAMSGGGAVYGDVVIGKGGKATFEGNIGSAKSILNGGAVYGNVTIGESAIVSFSGNYVTPDNAGYVSSGGAVYGNVVIGDSAIVSFFGNRSLSLRGGDGGAIKGTVVIGKNAQVEFIENSIAGGRGGAISSWVTIEDGANVVFSKNIVGRNQGGEDAHGGAIYTMSSISFSGKRVEFSENEALSKYQGTSTDAVITTSGGAIRANKLTFESGGEEFIFSKNIAEAGGAVYVDSNLTSADGFAGTITYSENTAWLYGGAIYGAQTITISGKDISFTDNTAGTSGGAIYATGVLTFSGANTQVTFSGNKIGNDTDGWTNNDIYAKSSVAIQDAGTYSFGGGIVATNATSTLSISGADVTFESGAVNAITGKTTISGAGTVVRFENTGNAFTGGVTVSTDASVEVVLTEAAKSTAIFNLNSKSLTIDDGLKITVADIDAVSLVAGTAYSYQIFDTAAGLSESHFTLDASLGASWVISGYDAGVLTLTAIPEPSAFGLLAGLGALALAGMRRRRK